MKPTDTHSIALITGASSGIGYQIARRLAALHYDVILVSNQETRLHQTAEELAAAFGVRTWAHFMDLCQADAAGQLYQWCADNQLQVDILVNNAGIFFFGEVVKTDIEKTRNIISLHVSTPAQLCALFGRDMKQRRSGHILIISSLSAWMPYPGIALYSATKLFLKSFARSLRSEMLPYHVNVTCICPGAVSTDLYALSPENHRTALRFGIMMRAETLARRSLRAMFRKRARYVPGFLNKIFLPLLLIVPPGLVMWFRRNSRFLPVDEE